MVKAKKGFNLFWTVLLSVASVLYVYPVSYTHLTLPTKA